MSYAQTIREQIFKARKERGWSQATLAERAGIKQSTVSRIETTTRGIEVDELVAIANVLDLKAGDMLPNSAGLNADMRPIIDRLRRLPATARARTLRVVDEIVGVREDAIAESTPIVDHTLQNLLPFPSLDNHDEMTDDAMARLASVMKDAGSEPRKAARGPEREVRFYGLASAGDGIEFFDDIPQEYRQIPQWAWNKGARGVFKAAGESMMDVGIFPDDIMFIKPTPEPSSGAIVICTVNKKVFVKKLHRDSRGVPVRLESKNPAYQPIELTVDHEIEFFGEVVGRTGDL